MCCSVVSLGFAALGLQVPVGPISLRHGPRKKGVVVLGHSNSNANGDGRCQVPRVEGIRASGSYFSTEIWCKAGEEEVCRVDAGNEFLRLREVGCNLRRAYSSWILRRSNERYVPLLRLLALF